MDRFAIGLHCVLEPKMFREYSLRGQMHQYELWT